MIIAKKYYTSSIAVLLLSLFYFFVSSNYALAGSMYFSPSSISRAAGQTFSVSVRVNTDGQAINAAQGSIVFDPQKAEVASISKSGSIFNLWTQEPKFSNTEGTVEFEGGLPNPGYGGAAGQLITISFRPKTATTINGSSDISLVSGAILANDGQGTNILTNLGKLSLTVTPTNNSPISTSKPEVSTSTDSSTPAIKSSTHPDSTKWYANKNPSFDWDLPKSVTAVSYLVTDKPESNPGPNSDGLIAKASTIDIADGIHYLHVKFKEDGIWGPIAHFQFNVDTTAPHAFEVNVADVAPTVLKRDLTFSTIDDASGIDRYEIKVGGGEPKVVSADQQSQSVTLTSGTNTVQVKAIDRAGNSVTASKDIEVTAPPTVSLGIAKWFSKPFDLLSNFLTKYGLWLLAAAGLIGLMLHLMKLFSTAYHSIIRHLKKERALKADMHQPDPVLHKIMKDMQEEIKFLNTVAKRRRLGPEEKYLKSKIEEYLKVIKNFQK